MREITNYKKYLNVCENKARYPVEFGSWKLKINGDLVGNDGRYVLHKECLADDDWIIHLFKKGVIMDDFIPAYFAACKMNNIQNLKMITYYD